MVLYKITSGATKADVARFSLDTLFRIEREWNEFRSTGSPADLPSPVTLQSNIALI